MTSRTRATDKPRIRSSLARNPRENLELLSRPSGDGDNEDLGMHQPNFFSVISRLLQIKILRRSPKHNENCFLPRSRRKEINEWSALRRLN